MNSLKELQKTWEGLAQADPLWSICTDPAKRDRQWGLEEFFVTGKKEVDVILQYVERMGIRIDRTSPVLDFGCGVGRLTRALAEYFPECCGIDISPTMIAMAQELNRNLPQCRFQLNDDARLVSLSDNSFGFIYTSIVLQHIAEPYNGKYIAELVRVLKPGGTLVFQVPERLRASAITRIRIKLALRSRLRFLLGNHQAGAMEMHFLPESVVRQFIDQNGAHVIDVRLTNSCEPSFSGSLRYLSQEPQAGYVSKQYCVVKYSQEINRNARRV